MRFRKELPETRLFPRRPVERVHEFFPSLFIENESCLIRKCLFGLFTGGVQNELGDIYTAALGRNFDERFLASRGSELKTAVFRMFRCLDRHGALCVVYCQRTPK